MNPEPSQTIDHKRSEIRFREKLSRQHTTGEAVLADYYGKEDHDRILERRIAVTVRDMDALRARGLTLGPFLELGAERGQRSLVMANDFAREGFAVDISFHQLRTMEHFAAQFGRPRLPIRICCDAHHLPFRTGAFPFAFCYEFLHHFLTPRPVLAEVRRVLGDGWFFFNEEPLKRPRLLHVHKRYKLYSEHERRKSDLRRFLEGFVFEPTSDEEEHGVIENDDVTLAEWRRLLELFDASEARLSSGGGRLQSTVGARTSLRNLPNVLCGGSIQALCRSQGKALEPAGDLHDLLACPDCDERPPLHRGEAGFDCTRCGARYPVRDGVALLLPPGALRALYPEFAD